jgi:hypothetical protein
MCCAGSMSRYETGNRFRQDSCGVGGVEASAGQRHGGDETHAALAFGLRDLPNGSKRHIAAIRRSHTPLKPDAVRAGGLRLDRAREVADRMGCQRISQDLRLGGEKPNRMRYFALEAPRLLSRLSR